MPKTLKDLFISQLQFKQTSPVPYAKLEFEDGIAGKMDHYYGSDKWRQTIRDAHIGLAGIEINEPEAGVFEDQYGTVWKAGKGSRYVIEPAIPKTSLCNFSFPKAENMCTGKALGHVESAINDNPDKFSIIGFGMGLFERSWALRGFENTLMDMVSERIFYQDLISNIAEHQFEIIKILCQTSADAVWFSDDWADQRGMIMGADRWRQFLKPHYKKLFNFISKNGKYSICHCCGNPKEVIPDCIELGLNCLQSLQPEAMNPYEVKEKYGSKISFWGGLGSQTTIPFGTSEEIKDEVFKLCRIMGKGGGYILGPAKTIMNDTPLKNAAATLEAFNKQLGTFGLKL